MPKLIMPFCIKGLYLEQSQQITAPSADFSKVSYFDKKQERVINPNMPYISENLVSQPFSNQGMTLEAGLHLHFILPKLFRSTIELPDEKGGYKSQFPAIPNRWLIIKNKEEKFIVESDYFYPEYEEGRQIEDKVTVPIPWEVLKKSEYHVPFRYMGRQYKLTSLPIDHSSAEYWYKVVGKPLTAMGYGEISFTGFVPNCKGILTFHDPQPKKDDVYEVWGWHDLGKNTKQVLKNIFSKYHKIVDTEKINKTISATEKETAQRKHELKHEKELWKNNWKIDVPFESEERENNSIFLYSKMTYKKNAFKPNIKEETYKIALGNSGIEAISAFLANEQKSKTLEEQLEAMQFDALKNQQIDLMAKFLEVRHEKTFNPKHGGWKYELIHDITPSTSNSATTRKAVKKLLEEPQIQQTLKNINNLLKRINRFQGDYDKNIRSIHSMQHQLFADWYKYMLCAHPPYKQDALYSPADKVLEFLFEKDIAPLNAKMKNNGQFTTDEQTGLPLNLVPDSTRNTQHLGDVTEGFTQQMGAPTIASSIVHFYNQLKKGLIHQLNKAIEEVQKLKLVELDKAIKVLNEKEKQLEDDPKNEDYQKQKFDAQQQLSSLEVFAALSHKKDKTSDEVIPKKIIYGLIKKEAQRYYEPNEPVLLLAKDKSDQQSTEINNSFKQKGNLLVANLKDEANIKYESILGTKVPINHTDWYKNNPLKNANKYHHKWLILDWAVDYRPINDPSIDGQGYPERFIVDSFDVKEDRAELEIKENSQQVPLSHLARLYTGSTILTSGTQNVMKDKLKEYEKEHRAFKAASVILEDHEILTQSLGGFNQALLMRKQTLQLEVGDPIAFEDYKPLIGTIAKFIGEARKSAPEPSHYFNPIRGGTLLIQQLNLIDTFGIRNDIYDANQDAKTYPIITSKTLALPEKLNLSATFEKQRDQLAYVPPRFIQPTRMNVRWIGFDEVIDPHTHQGGGFSPNFMQGPSDNPICGWILPNFLEQALDIFNQKGEALGRIGLVQYEKEAAIALLPKPGDTIFTLSSIKNQHLRNFVHYCIKEIEDKKTPLAFFNEFLKFVEKSLDTIEPQSYRQHNELSMLAGRPLAIVRASIHIEAMEEYAINQDWAMFKKDLWQRNPKRETYQFEKVKIPTRIGDYKQLNDGIIGYWYRNFTEENGHISYHNDAIVDKETINLSDAFYMPIANSKIGRTDNTTADDKAFYLIEQCLDEEPQIITLLMDPCGALTISSGILPVKSLILPTDFYKTALREMKIHFQVSPVITPYDFFEMPLPQYAGVEWNWIWVNRLRQLQEVPAPPSITRTKLKKYYQLDISYLATRIIEVVLNNKWLQKIKDEDGKIVYQINEKHHPLPKPFDILETSFEQLIKENQTEAQQLELTPIQLEWRLQTAHENLTKDLWDFLIKKQWLLKIPNNFERALINFDINTREVIEENEAHYGSNIVNEIFNQHYEGISAISMSPQYEQMCIREGWIKVVEI